MLIALAVVLPAVGSALRMLGVRRSYRILSRTLPISAGSAAIDDLSLAKAKRLGRLVNVAARHGPCDANCLRQSLALWWLLRRRGLPAEVRIGVGKDEARLHAHAWIELGGRVINDRASIASEYAVYQDLDGRLQGDVAGHAADSR